MLKRIDFDPEVDTLEESLKALGEMLAQSSFPAELASELVARARDHATRVTKFTLYIDDNHLGDEEDEKMDPFHKVRQERIGETIVSSSSEGDVHFLLPLPHRPEPTDQSGLVLCERHGYYWSEDGCSGCFDDPV